MRLMRADEPARLYWTKASPDRHQGLMDEGESRAHPQRDRRRGEPMSASTTVMTSSASVYATAGFWERLWRRSGLDSVLLFAIAWVLFGFQPYVATVFAGLA